MTSVTATQTDSAIPSTAERILDVAEALAQTRGYNGFSYADIAAEIGVTKASLHYHFPSKATLGLALVTRYSARFFAALDEIAASAMPAPQKLRAYADLYESVLVRDRLCLCGMFAAEIATLPAPVQQAVRDFFDTNERWVTTIFAEGGQSGVLVFNGQPVDAARALAAALDGAMLVARSFGDPSRFTSVVEYVLVGVTPRM